MFIPLDSANLANILQAIHDRTEFRIQGSETSAANRTTSIRTQNTRGCHLHEGSDCVAVPRAATTWIEP
jgi:hypothetical protein